MNTQSNAMPESFDSQRIAPAPMSATRPMYWSVRRELWENRSIYIAPLAVAVVVLVGFLIATIGRAMSMHDPALRAAVLTEPNTFAELLIMGIAFIVGVFYSLDALHGERRDRSILFWKSLPVSDLTTVLSKASIPLVVLPLLSFALTVATQWIMLLLSTAVMLGSGLSVAPLWTHMPLFQMWLLLLYHLFAVHVLWYAPIYGWLLLVSGWARRAVFLWAALPWLAIGIVEKIAFNTSHFAAWVGYRISGSAAGGSFTADNVSMDPLMQLTPGKFLSSAGLWIGLAFFAACIAAAVRLRRYQGPI
jgi:ABC-2 type transport system permease protein